MLRLIVTQGSAIMAAVEGFTRYKRVAAVSPRMGAVSLIQNHYGALHVSVHKVYQKVLQDRYPTLAPLHRACQQSVRFGEVHALSSGVRWGGGGGSTRRRCS